MNFRGIFMTVGAILIGLVVGVPIVTAIFATGGPFAGLVAIPNAGALSGNSYNGILTAIIALIPLLVVAYFAFRFFRSRV